MNKNNAIRQWAMLGVALGATAKDFEAVTVTPVEHVELKPVKAPEFTTGFFVPKHPYTAEEALRLHATTRNWATVARLMGKRKADVLSLVHKADPVLHKPSNNKELTVIEAVRKAIGGKNYKTANEVISEVREMNLSRPAYAGRVRSILSVLAQEGKARILRSLGQPVGYKLVG